MQITLRSNALSLPSTAMDDRDELRIPALPTARELRRARLLRRIAQSRLKFLALHLALGALGWAVIMGVGWGVYALIR
jgi:hypothetical protein